MKDEFITDEALDQLLFEYMPKANTLLDQLEEEWDKDMDSHIFSSGYKRNMKKIIKEYSRTPFQKKLANIRRYAAVILIIFILTNGVLIATAQAYREMVFRIITNIYEEFTSIKIEVEDSMDTADLELNFIEPTYIPERFEVVDDIQSDISRTIVYMKDNNILVFRHGLIVDGEMKIDTEGTSIKEMEVNNQMISYVFNKGMYLAHWFDDVYMYTIDAEVSFDEFVKILEGIIKK